MTSAEAAQTNQVTPQTAELPEIQTLNHVLNYPIVVDTIHAVVDGNPLGRTGKNLTVWSYQTFGKPFVPLLYKFPLTYASPYAKKLDELSDTILTKVDNKVPSVKKPTRELYSDTKSVVFWPVTKTKESLHHYGDLYENERRKMSQPERLTTKSKAAVSSALIYASQVLTTASQWVGAKRQNVQSAAVEVVKNIKERAERLTDQAKNAGEKAGEKASE